MIINKYLIGKIGHYANPRPLDTDIRDDRRSNVLKAVGSKMGIDKWNMFYNSITLKVNPRRKKSSKKHKKLNSAQSEKLLKILDIDYQIKREDISVYIYTEKKSTVHKYGIAVYRVNNELYDSDFRLIKIDRIMKTTLLSDYYQGEDEVQNAKLSL